MTHEELWAAVDRMLDRQPPVAALRAHRIEQLAARRLRGRGMPVPEELVAAERTAAVAALTAPVVLRRVRAAVDGPIVVLKGPEVAEAYPAPELRAYWDVDLLVPDAQAAQETLVAAGFVPIGDPERYADLHHLRPLAAPGLSLAVEVHDRPKWVDRLAPPDPAELFAAAVPSALDVPGVLALPRAQQALLLAVHAWAHEPLRRARDLFDVALVAEGVDPDRLRSLAREWGVARVWRSTERAIAAVSGTGRLPGAARLWARSLVAARERSVLEDHLTRCLAGFSALPPPQALAALGRALVDDVLPDDESWRAKTRRSLSAVRHASWSRSEHEATIELKS